ncbi:hypothetical protein AWB74_04709 [Caballeronia arvi]|uniref:Tli3-like domain-containing protein n=1 Tax=Caballeronia arvi TaxID=1777135 RepID=A0A158K0Q7_9BURK|nr:hypothetical protein [Caballeronia arvi]SAL74774.1 hypothetical protein AWB74_04709 [Caballeronia arvi]
MKKTAIYGALLLALPGCAGQQAQPAPFVYADFVSAKELPYDSPPQVIYRIDDHRFISLERYRDCQHGETFYNDTLQGIRKSFGRGFRENYQGRLIIADSTGKNLAFPASLPPHTACNDRGCTMYIAVSTDGGRTVQSIRYMRSFDPFSDSKDFTIIVSEDALYVGEKISDTTGKMSVDKHPLIPGYRYGEGGPLPEGRKIERGVALPVGLRTPSGQDRYSCDASIRPTNPDAPLK